MKFLCDNCKAKYQIADEKVAGKTVRMKCRKCGHLIEVKAAVTETSVAKSVPPPDGFEGGDHTIVGPPPSDIPHTLKHAGAAPPPRGTPLGAAKPPARSPSQHPPAGALAGAFQKSVHRDESSASRSMREITSADQWYVAINGVPVGPIRMSELRRKAAIGAVTEESLVWQEGLEEWRALRTYPELADAVREAATSGRASLTPGPPGEHRDSQPPRAPIAPIAQAPAPARGLQPSAVRSLTPAPPAARSNVVPITSRLATAEKLDEPMPIAADPFSVPQSASRPMEPISVAAASTTSAALAPPVLPIEQKRGVPWIPIAMLVLAACFGVTAAYAIFFRAPPPAPAPVVIVSAAAPPAALTNVPPPTDTVTNLDSVDTSPTASHKPGTATGPRPTATTAGTKPIDPAIAALLNNSTGGPSGGGPGPGGGGGGGALTSDQIEAVVRSHQVGVKRACWERINTTTPAVNVTAHVQVAPNGTVSSVDSDGNDPMVAKCIENSIRTWQFPPTGSSSTVNIPFHFLRQ